MICSHCGKQIKDEAKFCPGCGTPIHIEAEEAKVVTNSDTVDNNEPGIENTFATGAPKAKFDKKIWIPLVVVFCAIVIIAGVILLPGLSKSDGNSLFADNSADNYRNSYNMAYNLYVARNDKYIFYIGNNDCVIRMDADFGNRISMLEHKDVDSIYMVDEKLYFHSNKDHQVYSSDLNGENIQQITYMENSWFTVSNEALYFIEGYFEWDLENLTHNTYGDFALYKSSLDGTTCEKIIPCDASCVSIQDDYIIYYNSADYTVYSVNLDGTDPKVVCVNESDGFIFDYKIYKDKLYYSDNTSGDNISGLYCLDIKTGEEQKIVSTNPGDFTFWNDHIIYEADTNSSLAATHMCDLDGSNDKVILDGHIFSPLIMGDYMYYIENSIDSGILSYNLKTNTYEPFEAKRYEEIVFTDKYMFYIDNNDNNIYRCDHDGKNVIKLTNADCDYLYTYKNGLYYSGYANGYNSDNRDTPSGIHPLAFFRLNENGESCQAVEISGHNYIFYNDYVYFTSNFDSHIYRTKIDNIDNGDTDRPFIRRTGDGHYSTIYFIENDWIYFSYWKTSTSDSATIARMDLDGNNMQIVINSSAYDITVYENKIYYLKRDDKNNLQLRRANMDGSNDVLMLKSDISEFCIVDDIIYYISNTNKNIYSINLDGTRKTQLNNTACFGLHFNNDRIYYTDLYNHGYIYSMKLDGSDLKPIVKDNKKFKEKTDYKTAGIDDATAKEENKDVSFSASDIMTFEDPEFETFLCEMFQKGTITGADLLSVKFFGYYEGAPEEISVLRYHGKYRYLYENSVLFSAEAYPTGVSEMDVLCGDDSDEAAAYREGCSVVTVRSNEWMAEHVMPYLYYFKNMKHIVFGYCWVGDNPVLPIGVDWRGINPHARYFHEPYDPLYE